MQKIPVIQTIKHALSAVFHFRNAGIAIGLPWMLVLAGVRAIEFFFFSNTAPAEGDPAQAIIFHPADFIIAAFSMVVFSSIAVNWHRYILLDEVTASGKYFRLDRPVWNYAGRTLLIMMIALIPVLLLGAMLLSAFPSAGYAARLPFLHGRHLHHAHVGCPACRGPRAQGFRHWRGIADNPGQQLAICWPPGAERLDLLCHIPCACCRAFHFWKLWHVYWQNFCFRADRSGKSFPVSFQRQPLELTLRLLC